ncbi:hypothetical protein SAMN04515674_115147 [Pseudarcicella hirudinis]|uniref:Por secretion system C-terminal sorting domain-containing protein n=1 Tax=Pseudarcicella hirudinis TaxID=1079859 RepID=A0A1I5XSJ6_9BACT|nr:hypothetical protein [Pseudarcicella hirudinis]SFQ34932.1 hypothetical protein SAMN04515674_115147 [Pseudarcicella hirudinis]
MKNTQILSAGRKAFVAGLALSTVLSFSSLNTFASTTEPQTEPVQAKIVQVGKSLNFNVVVDKVANQKLTILIKDSENNEVHRDYVKVSTAKFGRTYDLSMLSDGTYTFEVVRNGKDVETKTFEIKTKVETVRDVTVASRQ